MELFTKEEMELLAFDQKDKSIHDIARNSVLLYEASKKKGFSFDNEIKRASEINKKLMFNTIAIRSIENSYREDRDNYLKQNRIVKYFSELIKSAFHKVNYVKNCLS